MKFYAPQKVLSIKNDSISNFAPVSKGSLPSPSKVDVLPTQYG